MSFKDRLKKRADRRGWSPAKLAEKTERREAIRDNVGGIMGGAVAELASGALQAIPFGNVAASAIKKLPIANKVPIVGDIANVGAIAWESEVALRGGVGKALLADALPAWEYIENGEYGKAALSVGLLVAVAVVVAFA